MTHDPIEDRLGLERPEREDDARDGVPPLVLTKKPLEQIRADLREIAEKAERRRQEQMRERLLDVQR